MASRPPFDVFNAESEDIESYLERLQEYFTAYDIKNDSDSAAKRRAILLTSIGSAVYRVLKDLSFPDAPNTKTFDQLATLLRGHFKPTRLKIAERYRFHSATQKAGQSIVEFVRELKSLAGTCEFTNEQLSDSLRDRFICGLRSEQIKRRLLSANFTFQEAVDAAIAQEIAQKDVRHLGANSQGENSSSVNQVKRENAWSRGSSSGRRHGFRGKQPRPTENQRKRCFRCGLTNHTPDNCKYKNSECFNCHLTGHLKSECPSGKPLRKLASKQHVHHTEQDSEAGVLDYAGDEFLGSIFTLEENQKSEPCKAGLSASAVKVPVQIEEVEFLMEVDTGAAASILNYADYERYFKYLALRPVQRSFHAYAGTPLDIAGQILVDVNYNGRRATLPLLVVRAERYAPSFARKIVDDENSLRLEKPLPIAQWSVFGRS